MWDGITCEGGRWDTFSICMCEEMRVWECLGISIGLCSVWTYVGVRVLWYNIVGVGVGCT